MISYTLPSFFKLLTFHYDICTLMHNVLQCTNLTMALVKEVFHVRRGRSWMHTSIIGASRPFLWHPRQGQPTTQIRLWRAPPSCPIFLLVGYDCSLIVTQMQCCFKCDHVQITKFYQTSNGPKKLLDPFTTSLIKLHYVISKGFARTFLDNIDIIFLLTNMVDFIVQDQIVLNSSNLQQRTLGLTNPIRHAMLTLISQKYLQMIYNESENTIDSKISISICYHSFTLLLSVILPIISMCWQ